MRKIIFFILICCVFVCCLHRLSRTSLAESLSQPADFLSSTASSPPVTLTIDPSSNRQAISPYIYGINIANWAPWYYMHMLEDRLWEAHVEVVRLGATNMERYNFRNNRMYNVISRQNDYVPLSWESFVDWVVNTLDAEPFLQVSVFGNVASDAAGPEEPDYSYNQSFEDVSEWVASTGGNVRFWGIGNEPFIAWKRHDYPPAYSDSAHGDQVLNTHTSYDYYFNRFAEVARAIKKSDTLTQILGPTPANWWFYWFNDYSPICPVTTPGGDAKPDAPEWKIMEDPSTIWNKEIFPDRGEDPDLLGWESDPKKIIPSYLQEMYSHENQNEKRLADYLDVHRYIRCITEQDAVQEPRGLFHEDFQSWDMETLFSGVKTNILNRFNTAITSYYPGTGISFSEYGYFYWDGYPSIPQIAAIGTMDYLGFFARGGVKLACSWYLGEPNQSGTDLTHAALDSARQAMFDEEGVPNPKYWAFYMMSNLFRGTSVSAEASDWDVFSVHACEKENGDYVVFAVNKGVYDSATGAYIKGRPPVRAQIEILPAASDSADSPSDTESLNQYNGNGNSPVLRRLLRYGLDDPYVIEMDTLNIEPDSNGRFLFDFHPLAIYAFVFSTSTVNNESIYNGNDLLPGNTAGETIQINPDILNFGPYEKGWVLDEEQRVLTHAVKITNTTQASLPWSVETDAPWITIEGSSNGEVSVTDAVYFTVDRSDLALGNHEADILVKTQNFEKTVKLRVDVIPGEDNGEKRIADFETGSFAHSLNITPPYSVAWWNPHGSPGDRNSPYLYDFYLDQNQVNRLGSRYCMRIDFDRKNGDNENSRLFQSFGTYGHTTFISSDDTGDEGGQTYGDSSSTLKYNATGSWEGYDAFEFDIKTDTMNNGHTAMLIVLTDESGNKGKPAFNNDDQISDPENYSDLLMIEDGIWQTILIPLSAGFFDWRYPQGQDGTETTMDFSSITQIEFVPWNGEETKSGVIYIDNLRLTCPDAGQNRRPVAVIEDITLMVKPGEPVTLNGSKSYDPDHDDMIISWRWIASDDQMADIQTPPLDNELSDFQLEHLSDPFSPSPVFSAAQEGVYRYDLVVTDGRNAQSRNIAQVMISVSMEGNSGGTDDDMVSTGGGSSGDGCFCSTLIAVKGGDKISTFLSWSYLIVLGGIALIFLFSRHKTEK